MFAIAGVTIFTLTCILGLVLIEEKKAKLEHRPYALFPPNTLLFEERRSEERSKIELKLPYQRLPAKDNDTGNGSTKNISQGGICVRLPEKVPVGTFIKIFIPKKIAHQYKTKNLTGKIVWVRGNGEIDSHGKRTFETGVQFLDNPAQTNLT